jgi:hypothetical protein
MQAIVRTRLATLAWLMTAAACSGGGTSAATDAGARASSAGAGATVVGTTAGRAVGGSTLAGMNAAGRSGGAGGATRGAAGASGQSAMREPDAMVPAGEAGATADADAGARPVDCGRCSAYGTPVQTGTVEPSELNALSGVAASRAQPEIVFAHNDHDRPVVYALDFQGREHARITLEGATSSDIEDIAVGPCGAQTCVYLADIGDNTAARSEYGILRFAQPNVPASAGNTAMTATFERFRFTYEDGSHNAESLMVAPDGTLYIVTKLAPGSGGAVKATGPSSVYKLPASISASSVARATKVTTLSVPASGEAAASAAAAHPCGQGFLLRTYDRVYEFLAPSGGSFEAAFSATPTVVAMPTEPQSEGIDYRADGRGFITSGEGAKAPIVVTMCRQ